MADDKKDQVLARMREDGVRFLRLQFTDIMGINKNVEVPEGEFDKALSGQILFDGSSVEGFARIEESDMLLRPDLDTYLVYPWDENGGKVARLICDIRNPDDTPFEGCPRTVLRLVCQRAADQGADLQLSPVARGYIAGLLKRAPDFCAVTNPLVNSYKRLVPGYEAPTHIAWSERNRSPLARVPARRGKGTRVELRMPDPSCNPYLALAVMQAAGLDGVEAGWDPGPPVNKNIFAMSKAECRENNIGSLPGDLGAAVEVMAGSEFARTVLGEHIFDHYVTAKRQEWREYIARVHSWEVDRYLTAY